MASPHRPAYKSALAGIAHALGKICAISPKNVQEAVSVCQQLARSGIPSTIGKFSTVRDEPSGIVQEYCFASKSLEGVTKEDFHLSVKPPALHFSSEHLTEIASTALGNGHRIHFDSHGYDIADQTLDYVDQLLKLGLFEETPSWDWCFSVTLPSRWRRSERDAEWAIERGLRVRLVKGEFRAANSWDEAEPKRHFLELVDKLAGRVPEIAIATHDDALAREALARCQSSGSSIQLELLYLSPVSRLIQLSREAHVPVAFYVPYSDVLLIYAVRHLLTNPHKLLRDNPLGFAASSKSKLASIIDALKDRPA